MWYEDLNTLVISMYPSTHSPIFPSTNQHPSIHPFINWILRDLNVNSDSDWFIFVHLWFIVKWHHPKNQLRSETHTRLFSLCHINVFQWERPGIWFPWIQTVYQIHMSNSNSSQIQRMKPNRRPEPSVRLSTPAGTSPSPCESWFVCVCVNDVNKKEVKKKKHARMKFKWIRLCFCDSSPFLTTLRKCSAVVVRFSCLFQCVQQKPCGGEELTQHPLDLIIERFTSG